MYLLLVYVLKFIAIQILPSHRALYLLCQCLPALPAFYGKPFSVKWS